MPQWIEAFTFLTTYVDGDEELYCPWNISWGYAHKNTDVIRSMNLKYNHRWKYIVAVEPFTGEFPDIDYQEDEIPEDIRDIRNLRDDDPLDIEPTLGTNPIFIHMSENEMSFQQVLGFVKYFVIHNGYLPIHSTEIHDTIITRHTMSDWLAALYNRQN